MDNHLTMTLEELDTMTATCWTEIHSPETRNNWQKKVYMMTKMFLSLYARILSRFDQVKEKEIAVFSMHPGFCSTEMTARCFEIPGSRTPKLTADDGAKTAIYLIELGNVDQLEEGFQGGHFYQSGLYSLTVDFVAY